MDRIAEAECATCYVIRPKTEMRPVRIRRKSGTSFAFWRSSMSDRTGNSYRTSYSHDQVWVCKGCKAPRSDWTPLHYAAAAIALWLAWLFVTPLLSSGDRTRVEGGGTNAAPLTNGTDILSNDADVSESGSSAGETESEPSTSAAAASENNVNAPNETAPSALSQANGPDPLDIIRARNAALNTGSAAKWESNGLSGWVTVSEPVATSRGVCKTISVQNSDREQMGDVETWCSAPGSSWSQD